MRSAMYSSELDIVDFVDMAQKINSLASILPL
jgi:hypothetical protein